MGIEICPPGSRFGLFGTNEAGLQLHFEPVRVAANVERQCGKKSTVRHQIIAIKDIWVLPLRRDVANVLYR